MSYIKLEDAKNAILRYICEQTISKYSSVAECKAAKSGAEGAFNEIDYIPTADVVEVVRCKDCNHWKDTSLDSRVTEPHWGECRKPLGDYRYCETSENDYCSYGERREGND